MKMLGFGKKSKIKKPHFMKRKSWYMVLTPDYRMPEDPDIDMVLTPKASEKAIYSYQRYYGLGVLTIFFMENGSICEESIDIWSPKERAKEQEMHDAAFKESDFTMIKIENIKPTLSSLDLQVKDQNSDPIIVTATAV